MHFLKSSVQIAWSSWKSSQKMQKTLAFFIFLIKKTLLFIACPAIEGERNFHANMFFHRQFNDFPWVFSDFLSLHHMGPQPSCPSPEGAIQRAAHVWYPHNKASPPCYSYTWSLFIARLWGMKIPSTTFSRCGLCVFFVFEYGFLIIVFFSSALCARQGVFLYSSSSLFSAAQRLFKKFMTILLAAQRLFLLKNKSELDMFNWSDLLCERSFILQRSSIFSHYILNSRAAQLFFLKKIFAAQRFFFWETNQSLICSINSNAPICVFFHASTLNVIFIL